MPPLIDTSRTRPADPDLAEQAKPGHGVPSQDPDPVAQHPIDAALAEDEEKTVYMGAGVMAGAASGAAIGTAVAGAVGVLVGGTLGAVAGALGGAAVGAAEAPKKDEDKADATDPAHPGP